MTLLAKSMKPISVKVRGKSEIVCETVYKKSRAFIRFETFGKKDIDKQKKIWTTDITYDQRTLFWLLRGYPFKNVKNIKIDLVMPLGNRCSMNVRYVGKENVVVPAGRFRAYKLEMEPDAVLPFFSKRLKIFFWYSTEKIPKFLKYEYPGDKIITELIEAVKQQPQEKGYWSLGTSH